MVGPAAESRPLFIAKTERNTRRLFELQGVRVFRCTIELREFSIHADDFQRLLAEVMGFLRIEREDLIGGSCFGNDNGNDALGPQRPHGRQAMVAVRCPILRYMVGFCDAHGDDRIEKATDFPDDPFQLSDMGVGSTRLIGKAAWSSHCPPYGSR